MRTRRARDLVQGLRSGRITRREAILRAAAVGLSAGGIASLVSQAAPGIARAAAPAKRGSAGTLKLLYWQAPTILNAHLSHGTKDFEAARICCEPLLTVDAAGNFTPVLADRVPSRANGQLAADGTSIVYTLKRGVKWADGRPFTSDDVVFTFQFVQNKQSGATTYASYVNVAKVEPLNAYTVKVTFKAPTPAWYLPFVGTNGVIVPRHALDGYVGTNAQNAPFNSQAFGTGPYKVDQFRPGDLVVFSINEYYRDPDKPAFSQVQMKGGGDATSAARAALQTGEYDYAWNLQVEWPVLQAMMNGGRGTVITGSGGGVEMILCNMTDPNKTVDGQRSSLKAPHLFLTDPKVRQALAMAVDRQTIATQLYGVEGDATANVLTTPTNLASKNTKIVYDIGRANQLLDEAGYRRGPDGIRAKGDVKLQLTLATTVNSLRQKEQEVIKQGWGQLGVVTTLKAVDAGVFFSTDPGNNDTDAHFYNDVEMLTSTYGSPFPSGYMARYYSGQPEKDLPQKENAWSGFNYPRWQSPEYNKLYDAAQAEFDPKKNAQLWIQMNDLVVAQGVSIPLVDRKMVSGHASSLDVGSNLSPFDNETRNIADWQRRG